MFFKSILYLQKINKGKQLMLSEVQIFKTGSLKEKRKTIKARFSFILS